MSKNKTDDVPTKKYPIQYLLKTYHHSVITTTTVWYIFSKQYKIKFISFQSLDLSVIN